MEFPSGAVARFARGVGLPFQALGYLARRPALWRYAILPVVVTIAGVVAGLLLSLPLSGWVLGLVWTRPGGWALSGWLLAQAALVVGTVVVLALVLPAVVSAPFADRLSARVEELELGPACAGSLSRAMAETWRGQANSMARVLRLLVGLALLLPTAVVPFVYPVLAFVWTARWTTVQWLELPMARNLHTIGEVREALRAVRPAGFGMGALLTLAVVVPFFDFLVVPIGAVAGALLYCDLVRAGLISRTAGPGEAPSGAGGAVGPRR